jgi:hypothetical protein
MIHGLRAGFTVHSAQNVRFAGFAIDMARQPYVYGQCVAVTDDTFTIEFDPALYEFPSDHIPPWMLQVQAVMQFDPKAWRMATDAVDIYTTSAPLQMTLDAVSNRLTVQGMGQKRDKRIKPGAWFVLRNQVYSGNGFTIIDSSNVTVEDVTFYSLPGMGLYAKNSSDLLLRRVGVRRRTGRPMSITADAAHFNGCYGTVSLTDTYFEGQGDDGLNVHGMFHDVRASRGDGLFLMSGKQVGCSECAVWGTVLRVQ